MHITLGFRSIAIVSYLTLTALPALAITEKQQKMIDQLDSLDHMDFIEASNAASSCISSRNFVCANKKIIEASKTMNSAEDKSALNTLKQNLNTEIALVAEEARLRAEEDRRLAEEERRIASEEARERRAQEFAEREAERNSQPSTASQIAMFGALFNQAYASQLESSRAIRAATEAYAQRARAEQNAQTQRNQERFAQQRAQIQADRRTRELQVRDRILMQAQVRQQGQIKQEQVRQQEQIKQEQIKQAQLRQQEELNQAQVRQQEQIKQAQNRMQEQTQREEKSRQAAASKLAEQQAAKQASEQYLRNVAAGTRLVATKCPDGEGKYYATGSRPKIRPEVVSCVNIRFRASCPGGREYSDVTAHNFIGMSGCFGDTYEISPKLSCQVDQVQISVLDALPCR